MTDEESQRNVVLACIYLGNIQFEAVHFAENFSTESIFTHKSIITQVICQEIHLAVIFFFAQGYLHV